MDKSVVDAMSALNSAFDEPVVIRMGDRTKVQGDRMSTGSYQLDKILGGGFVRGRLYEIYGPESSGKTTICLHAMAEAQKFGLVLFVDTEHAFDPVYAASIGVDVDNLLVCQPNYAEQAFDVMEKLVSTGFISLCVADSIAGFVPKKEMEGDPGDSNMGLHARTNRQHVRKIVTLAGKTDTIILYTNQITFKIGVMFGSPETTTGGTSFKFFCSGRIDIRRISTLKDSAKQGSIRCKVKTVKNKTYIPFQEAEFDIEFGTGISNESEILDLGEEAGAITKAGSWYSIADGERIGQGRFNAVQTLRDNPEFIDIIRQKMKEIKDAHI